MSKWRFSRFHPAGFDMYNHHPRFKSPGRTRGVTLLELVATLAIVTVLLTLGAPSFTSMLAKSRLEAASRALQADLVFAREEARNSASLITLCMSADGATCGAAGWKGGHIVFRDGGAAGAVGPADTLLRHGQAVDPGVSIGATILGSGDAYTQKYFSFDSDGKLVGENALRFTLCAAGQLPSQLALRLNGNLSGAKGDVKCL